MEHHHYDTLMNTKMNTTVNLPEMRFRVCINVLICYNVLWIKIMEKKIICNTI